MYDEEYVSVDCADILFPLNDLTALTPSQLALSFLNPTYDPTSEPVITKLWRYAREKLRHEIGAIDHRIRSASAADHDPLVDFELLSYADVTNHCEVMGTTSSQLVILRFNPTLTREESARRALLGAAEEELRRRRELVLISRSNHASVSQRRHSQSESRLHPSAVNLDSSLHPSSSTQRYRHESDEKELSHQRDRTNGGRGDQSRLPHKAKRRDERSDRNARGHPYHITRAKSWITEGGDEVIDRRRRQTSSRSRRSPPIPLSPPSSPPEPKLVNTDGESYHHSATAIEHILPTAIDQLSLLSIEPISSICTAAEIRVFIESASDIIPVGIKLLPLTMTTQAGEGRSRSALIAFSNGGEVAVIRRLLNGETFQSEVLRLHRVDNSNQSFEFDDLLPHFQQRIRGGQRIASRTTSGISFRPDYHLDNATYLPPELSVLIPVLKVSNLCDSTTLKELREFAAQSVGLVGVALGPSISSSTTRERDNVTSYWGFDSVETRSRAIQELSGVRYPRAESELFVQRERSGAWAWRSMTNEYRARYEIANVVDESESEVGWGDELIVRHNELTAQSSDFNVSA